MPRRPRPSAAGVFHVASRAQARESLFRDDADFLRFEGELRSSAEAEVCTCIAACALSTHYHLLVETGDGALSRFMKRLNERYARAFNARYGRRGHAFADRYLCVPIEDDAQLLTAFRYVARNPVDAGICREPADWRWSSYTTLVGGGDRFAFADGGAALALCNGSLAALQRFVESGA
jgi:REP-associated tyrosine transposase